MNRGGGKNWILEVLWFLLRGHFKNWFLFPVSIYFNILFTGVQIMTTQYHFHFWTKTAKGESGKCCTIPDHRWLNIYSAAQFICKHLLLYSISWWKFGFQNMVYNVEPTVVINFVNDIHASFMTTCWMNSALGGKKVVAFALTGNYLTVGMLGPVKFAEAVEYVGTVSFNF